ncbi:hypothetical protein HK097_010472 [Rhizophlyctis rosea]|uniref:Peptidase M20 dimerisation domain-containing protein n=1 Tax=Rhizophlyctis rosea TaxID=64517 RepID=A0AAD5SIM1_9FUNG|nr:hypothetical protein HK097_010472 [Rhizophlyctis rosea]
MSKQQPTQSLTETLSLLKSLIQIPSTTLQEHAVALHLRSYLQSHNWHVHLQPLPSHPDRFNVLAWRGTPTDSLDSLTGRKFKVLMNSHIDTVPPHIEYGETETRVTGRGACDAKGSVASQIVAVEELIREGRVAEEDVGLLYVASEETDHIGMIAASSLPISTNYLIVGEPTELKLALGHKGVLKADIKVTGKAGHSGYPHVGRNAIDALVDVLGALKSAPWPHDPRLGPTTLNFGSISGGVAANVIAASATADIAIRVSTSAAEVSSLLLSTVEKVKEGLQDGIAVEVSVRAAMDPVRCETVDVEGVETFVAGYFTDIPYLKGDHKPLLYGPGSILVAHSKDEFVEKADLEVAVGVYKQIILGLVGRG